MRPPVAAPADAKGSLPATQGVLGDTVVMG